MNSHHVCCIKVTMSRIILNTFGSFGDIHPYLAVAIALKRRGHTPVLATSEVYRAKVEAQGIAFAPVRPDVGELLNNTAFIEKLWHPRRGTEFLVREYLLPTVRESYADLLPISEGADLLLTHAIAYAGPIVAEKLRLPWLSVALQPLLFLSAEDRPALPLFPFLHRFNFFGPGLYRAIFALGRAISSRWAKPIHDLRASIGLPRLQGHPFFDGMRSPYGTLAWFSRHFAQAQSDWPRNVTICGFPFHDEPGSQAPDRRALQAFLDAGEPPVLFTLGSSAVLQAGSFYRESLRAAQQSNWRAVLLVGIEDRESFDLPLPSNVHIASYAPYAEVMPRCAAIVHQGGIGTTAQALRAGRPMVVVPWAHDQPDNARRIVKLGAGRIVSRSHYSADRIADELQQILGNSSYGAKARQLGLSIAAEDGAATACEAIEAALGALHHRR
jgi:rhamnosyltransferase subunit B